MMVTIPTTEDKVTMLSERITYWADHYTKEAEHFEQLWHEAKGDAEKVAQYKGYQNALEVTASCLVSLYTTTSPEQAHEKLLELITGFHYCIELNTKHHIENTWVSPLERTRAQARVTKYHAVIEQLQGELL